MGQVAVATQSEEGTELGGNVTLHGWMLKHTDWKVAHPYQGFNRSQSLHLVITREAGRCCVLLIPPPYYSATLLTTQAQLGIN